jgi:proline-rich protein PRCC
MRYWCTHHCKYCSLTDGSAAAEVREVRGQRYNPATGETETVVGASKGQKRKHQINSLAAQAAAMELELMDKRGSGFLTKAQTQAKYGW